MNPLKSDDMSSTSTWCHLGGSCKALFVVLATFCEQKTYNVHADEGQPAQNSCLPFAWFALHKHIFHVKGPGWFLYPGPACYCWLKSM